ncbi:MAG TPA: GGDEF domain-containing protein [Peptococcaceae bacterium]|nr:GGDEF domain-containing protein [Peptococcaceae bacterium]
MNIALYVATYILDIGALFYLIGLLYSSTALNVYRKKPFLIGIILTVIIILSEAGTVFTENGSLNFRSLNILCNIFGFALTPMIPIAITLIFDSESLIRRKLLLVPTLINVIATVLSPLLRLIFYVDANNQYIRGKATKQMAGSKGFSVIALDINDFKSVNDTYGHDYGDTVIKAVAEIIRKSFTNHYNCYRFGGDEFFIISKETNKEKLEYQLRTMINNLEKEREKGNPLPTVSYGYSIFRGGEKLDFSKIIKEADDQMYYYKKIHKSNTT